MRWGKGMLQDPCNLMQSSSIGARKCIIAPTIRMAAKTTNITTNAATTTTTTANTTNTTESGHKTTVEAIWKTTTKRERF